MPAPALLLTLVVSLLFAPVDAKCADACEARFGTGRRPLTLATGSPGELGLLSALADLFAPRENVTLCWIKAGTGEALELLRNGKTDLIMVHAPAAEKNAIADGWAAQRTLIGSNEFFVVGPTDDPAKVADAKDVVDAFMRAAKAKSRFFSRGDDSGTHRKEMEIWKKAGISPSGDWYVVTKEFMLATLKRANDEKGYFMTDSSTWVTAAKDLPRIKILFRGDPFIVNTYHALRRPGGGPEAELAGRFIEFLVSPDGQRIIGEFGRDRFGEGLYNDAEYARKFLR